MSLIEVPDAHWSICLVGRQEPEGRVLPRKIAAADSFQGYGAASHVGCGRCALLRAQEEQAQPGATASVEPLQGYDAEGHAGKLSAAVLFLAMTKASSIFFSINVTLALPTVLSHSDLYSAVSL